MWSGSRNYIMVCSYGSVCINDFYYNTSYVCIWPDSGDSVQYVYDKAPPSKSSDKKTSKDSDASNKDHEAHSIAATTEGDHDTPSHLTDTQSNGHHADLMNHDGHHSVATV